MRNGSVRAEPDKDPVRAGRNRVGEVAPAEDLEPVGREEAAGGLRNQGQRFVGNLKGERNEGKK